MALLTATDVSSRRRMAKRKKWMKPAAPKVRNGAFTRPEAAAAPAPATTSEHMAHGRKRLRDHYKQKG